MQIQFISGLPRSGSTLLASILAQNTWHRASIMSPVGRLVTALHDNMGSKNEAAGFFTDATRIRVLRGVFETYYADTPERLVFDTNRRWCANVALLRELYPHSKLVCCIRPPAQIVDSLERLFQQRPLRPSVIHGGNSNSTVYDRTAEIMGRDGVLGFALYALRSAYYGPHRDQLHLVEYKDLCQDPEGTMAKLHVALDMPPFQYDFTNIQPIDGSDEFDDRVNTPGLHSLRPTVGWRPQAPVLPPDIYNGLPAPFWYPHREPTPVKGTVTPAK